MIESQIRSSPIRLKSPLCLHSPERSLFAFFIGHQTWTRFQTAQSGSLDHIANGEWRMATGERRQSFVASEGSQNQDLRLSIPLTKARKINHESRSHRSFLPMPLATLHHRNGWQCHSRTHKHSKLRMEQEALPHKRLVQHLRSSYSSQKHDAPCHVRSFCLWLTMPCVLLHLHFSYTSLVASAERKRPIPVLSNTNAWRVLQVG